MTRLRVLLLLAAVACGRPKEETTSDSNTLAAIDTLKPAAPDAIPNRDTVDPVAAVPTKGTTPVSAPAKTSPARPANSTKAAQPPLVKDSTKLGRDVAVPFDPTKRRLPTVDTTKKRPPL